MNDIPLSHPVVLRGRFQNPVVLGKEVRRLTKAQFDVIQSLLKAGEPGLSKDDLDRESGHPEARKILRRLRRADENWAAVIEMAGSTGIGYRIVNPVRATT